MGMHISQFAKVEKPSAAEWKEECLVFPMTAGASLTLRSLRAEKT